jgi:hypothetical protein
MSHLHTLLLSNPLFVLQSEDHKRKIRIQMGCLSVGHEQQSLFLGNTQTIRDTLLHRNGRVSSSHCIEVSLNRWD